MLTLYENGKYKYDDKKCFPHFRSDFSPTRISKLSVRVASRKRLYNFDPLKSHFYIVNLGFIGVYIIFLISAQRHRLWVLVRTAS